nr:UbiA family prenyltransferase [Amycolatopsis granulosa]
MWRDVAAVHRLDFSVLVLVVCYGWWGASFTAADAAQLVSPPVLLAVVANGLLFLGGLLLNTVADLDTDARHADKGGLTAAARRFGHAAWWSVGEIGAGLAAAVAVTALTGHLLPTLAGAATALAHSAYNLNPVRAKHRGFPGAFVFGAAVGALPFLVSAGAVVPRLPGWAWWLALGLTALSTGRTVWWSVPDVSGDRKAGAATPSVRHGARKATAVACVLMLAGLAAATAGLWRFGVLRTLLALSVHLVVFVVAAAPVVHPQGAPPSFRTMSGRVLVLVAVADLFVLVMPVATLLQASSA